MMVFPSHSFPHDLKKTAMQDFGAQIDSDELGSDRMHKIQSVCLFLSAGA